MEERLELELAQTKFFEMGWLGKAWLGKKLKFEARLGSDPKGNWVSKQSSARAQKKGVFPGLDQNQ